MMLANSLESENLLFEPLAGRHAKDFITLVMNENVMLHITGHGLSSNAANDKFRAYVTLNQSVNEIGYFAVFLKESAAFVGVAKLIPFGDTKTEAEVGYMLLPEFWNRGYASQMVDTMLKLARHAYLHRVIAIIDPVNIASERVLKKFDFTIYLKSKIENLPAHYYELILK